MTDNRYDELRPYVERLQKAFVLFLDEVKAAVHEAEQDPTSVSPRG